MNEVAMTFGQKAVLRAQQLLTAEAHFESAVSRVDWEVPPWIGVGELEQALVILAHRHDVLRTTYWDLAGPEPVQVLAAEAEPSFSDKPVFLGDGQRCWGASISSNARGTWLTIRLHRIIADEASVNLFLSDLDAIVKGAALPEPVSPRNLAVEQRAASWRKRRSAAVRYWGAVAEHLHGLPARIAEQPIDEAVVAFAAIPAQQHRLTDTAAQLGLTPSGVLTLALAQLVLPASEQDAAVIMIQLANRSELGLHLMMGNQSQTVPLVLHADEIRDADTADRAEVIRWKLVHAQRHGMHDPDVPRELGWHEGSGSHLVNYTETQGHGWKSTDKILRRVFHRPRPDLNDGLVVSMKNAQGHLILGIRGPASVWERDAMSLMLDRFIGIVQGDIPMRTL